MILVSQLFIQVDKLLRSYVHLKFKEKYQPSIQLIMRSFIWLVSLLVCWLVGWLVCWLVGWVLWLINICRLFNVNEPGSNNNEGVHRIPQISQARASLSDVFILSRTLIGVVLRLSRVEIGVFYSLKWLGFFIWETSGFIGEKSTFNQETRVYNRDTDISIFYFGSVECFLWHINSNGLFNVKTCGYTYIRYLWLENE